MSIIYISPKPIHSQFRALLPRQNHADQYHPSSQVTVFSQFYLSYHLEMQRKTKFNSSSCAKPSSRHDLTNALSLKQFEKLLITTVDCDETIAGRTTQKPFKYETKQNKAAYKKMIEKWFLPPKHTFIYLFFRVRVHIGSAISSLILSLLLSLDFHSSFLFSTHISP